MAGGGETVGVREADRVRGTEACGLDEDADAKRQVSELLHRERFVPRLVAPGVEAVVAAPAPACVPLEGARFLEPSRLLIGYFSVIAPLPVTLSVTCRGLPL